MLYFGFLYSLNKNTTYFTLLTPTFKLPYPMWARNIDGVIMVSEDLAERIKEIAVPGLAFTANEKTYTLGKSMDLERTGDDNRFWFYTEDEGHALFLHLLGSENIYEVGIMERKTYWFGAIKETTLPITSLTFPGIDFVITKNEIREEK